MESELSGISNENQISWFGFSATSFSDCVFNAYVDSWKEVCSEEFQTSLKQLRDRDRVSFLTFPFTVNSVDKKFKIMKRYCVSVVFKIPASVTLPECKKMNLAAVSDPKNHKQAEKEYSAKLEKIRMLRIELAQRKKQIESLDESIQVLHSMEKGEEQLINQNKAVFDSPSRKMSQV